MAAGLLIFDKRYIFNPEHDLCIANGDENFVPPRSAMGFAKDNIDLSEYLKRPNKQRRQIIPWGWNHALKKRLINEGVDPATLPSEEELQFIRTHSRREFALDVHSRLSCADSLVIRPDYRIVATCIDEIEAFISTHGSAVLKSPLSGSGKGIRFVREGLSESDKGWCRRTLDKQGSMIVERRFEIIKECAMLFECHHEGIDFIGYSLFESRNGAYSRNILASNENIEDIISEYIPRNTLIAAKAWAAGEIKMPVAKRAILNCHALAKKMTSPTDSARCHAIAQGFSVVHTTGHALGLPIYELTAIVRELGVELFQLLISLGIAVNIRKKFLYLGNNTMLLFERGHRYQYRI